MSVEIEAKMKVESFELIRHRLETLGGLRQGLVREVNVFFDTDDRTLLAADKGLRLRTNSPVDGDENHVVTFKGPRQHGPLKSREEKELRVADAKDASALFEALGYRKILSFEKNRESWKLNGCSVELDELPYLGLFVEIEGPDDQTVMKLREAMALGQAPIIKASYIAMLMSHLQEAGDTKKVVRFK